MQDVKKYKVYNTIISSEVQLLNIPFSQGEAEATITYADAPSSKIPADFCGTYYSAELIALGTAYGTIEVEGGDSIKVFLYENCTDHDIAPFIIGWGFAFLFFQRGYTIFHCSALRINGQGLLVSGVSGAGKSTTALRLIQKGAKYMADDQAIFKPAESMDIIPAFPIQKVCRDVSTGLPEEYLLHINEGRDKFSYNNETDYYDQPTRLTTVVMLNIADCEEVKCVEYQGLNKMLKLMSCMYLCELHASFGIPNQDKFNCLKMAEKVRVIEITRPRGKNTLDEITNLIFDYMSE